MQAYALWDRAAYVSRTQKITTFVILPARFRKQSVWSPQAQCAFERFHKTKGIQDFLFNGSLRLWLCRKSCRASPCPVSLRRCMYLHGLCYAQGAYARCRPRRPFLGQPSDPRRMHSVLHVPFCMSLNCSSTRHKTHDSESGSRATTSTKSAQHCSLKQQRCRPGTPSAHSFTQPT